MQWSTDKPVCPGWYWYRVNGRGKPQMVSVFKDFTNIMVKFYLTSATLAHRVAELDGQWSGPLTPPED